MYSVGIINQYVIIRMYTLALGNEQVIIADSLAASLCLSCTTSLGHIFIFDVSASMYGTAVD